MVVGEEGDYIYLLLHRHRQNDSFIKCGPEVRTASPRLRDTVAKKELVRYCKQVNIVLIVHRNRKAY